MEKNQMAIEMTREVKEEVLDAACSMTVLAGKRAMAICPAPTQQVSEAFDQPAHESYVDLTVPDPAVKAFPSCNDPSSPRCSSNPDQPMTCTLASSSTFSTPDFLIVGTKPEDDDDLTDLDEDEHEDSGYGDEHEEESDDDEEEREMLDIFKSMDDFEKYAIEILTDSHPAVTIEKKRSAHTSTISCRHRRAQYYSCTWYMKATEMENGKWELSEEYLFHNRACLEKMDAKLVVSPFEPISSNAKAVEPKEERSSDPSTTSTISTKRNEEDVETNAAKNNEEDEEQEEEEDIQREPYESSASWRKRKAKRRGNVLLPSRAHRYKPYY